ncbi:MAG TPA: adenylate/guanylate cyclase domain-containing protein [Candidatus Tectomicrobia bacterium]|nr:adenylate/guanylate cyclase domain-containing protein [Candidatus Tectomicrobia bacterium]
MPRFFRATSLGLLIAALGLAVGFAPLGHDLEESVGLQVLFKLRGTRQPPDDVVIVGIDDVSATALGLPNDVAKWPRSHHARLTDMLAHAGARMIAFDIIFGEARVTEHDQLFADAIQRARNVILFEYLTREKQSLSDESGSPLGHLYLERRVPPIPLLADAAVALAPFPLPKVPIRVNQYWTFKTAAADMPTLPVVALQLFASGTYDQFLELLKQINPLQAAMFPPHREAIRPTSIEAIVRRLRTILNNEPLTAQRMLGALQRDEVPSIDPKHRRLLTSLIRMYRSPESHYLNFYGPPGSIATVPYYQVLQLLEGARTATHRIDFNGKAVFVGLSERLRPEQKDGFYTVFSQPSGFDLSGVEIAATAFANLLEDMPIRPLQFHNHLTVIFLWGILLGLIGYLLPTTMAIPSALIMSVIYLTIAYHQFSSIGSWYPLIIPLLGQMPLACFGAVLWKYFDTSKERQKMRKLFGYYIPNKVIDQLLRGNWDFKAGNQLVYGVCLYTDAAQSASLAEKMDPQELGSFMNRYYEVVFTPIQKHGGIVSDVIGDSVLAIWATTHSDPALRQQTCLAALEIASAVQQFNRASGTGQLPTRIGLHCGHMLLGSVGAVAHYEYRAVGDIVITATRMEGLNKYLGTQILVSAEGLDHVEGFLTRELGEFLLVGKSKSLVVYELICRVEEANGQQRVLCAEFAEALAAFRRERWEEAIEKFDKCIAHAGEDGPSLYYKKLCEQYRKNPPGEPWDGIVRLTQK